MIAQGQYSITVVYDGTDGIGIEFSTVFYYLSSSNTELKDGAWTEYTPVWMEGYYYWQKVVTIYSNQTQSESAPVCISGESGTDGRGIESIETEFYLSDSKETQSGSNWQKTMPEWESGKYLWTRNKIVYYNPASTVYTSPICDSSWEAINDVVIGGRNLIIRSNETKVILNEDGSESENDYYVTSDYIALVPNAEYMFTKTSSALVDTDVGGYFKYAWYSDVPLVDEEDNFTGYTFIGFSYHSENEYKWIAPSDAYFIRISYPADCLVQFEKGNKATDYTPAPEDIEQDYSDKIIELTREITTTIEQTESSIKNEVSEKYYTKEDTDSLVSEISTSLTQTKDSFEMTFTNITNSITNLDGTVNANYQELKQYIRFEGGTITLGEENNPLILTLSNDRMSFCQNTNGNEYTEVAYVSDNKLWIYDGEFLNSLKIGRWVFIPRTNGNLSFTYI